MRTAMDHRPEALCNHIIRRESWELLNPPTNQHAAFFKNKRTHKVYQLRQIAQVQTTRDALPAIFLHRIVVSDRYCLSQKYCRSLADFNFKSTSRSFTYHSEEEIANTLSPVLAACSKGEIPADYTISRESVVIDCKGKIRLLHPDDLPTRSPPGLEYMIRSLVMLLTFGEEFQRSFLEQTTGEEGMINFTRKLLYRNFSEPFSVFVMAILKLQIDRVLLSKCVRILKADYSVLNDQTFWIVREWFQKTRNVCQQLDRFSASQNEHTDPVQTTQTVYYSQQQSVRRNRRELQPETERKPTREPPMSKYRNGVRYEPQWIQQQESDSYMLPPKSQITEQESRAHREDISL